MLQRQHQCHVSESQLHSLCSQGFDSHCELGVDLD